MIRISFQDFHLRESEGEELIQDFTFDPSQQFDIDIPPPPVIELIPAPVEDKNKNKVKIKKYRYPKSKFKPHYLKNGRRFKIKKTSRRHKSGF